MDLDTITHMPDGIAGSRDWTEAEITARVVDVAGNADGVFDSRDVVAALQTASCSPRAHAAVRPVGVGDRVTEEIFAHDDAGWPFEGFGQ